MRTLGIDFAAQPVNTALCEMVWDADSATVVQVAGMVTDDVIRAFVQGPPSRIFGVDVPFGWPAEFVAFVAAHHARTQTDPDVSMAAMRLRTSDQFIHERFKKQPLSVSTDKLAIPAIRCARLLQEFGVTNRAGDGRWYEVYPAAARLAWDLPAKDNATALALIQTQCPIAFASPGLHAALLDSEHAFDALLCSLATRAAALGMTYLPPAELLQAAKDEGWIHAPVPGSLSTLISAETAEAEILAMRASEV
ncbi:MAG: DUF429 domain-containing protein [Thermomicrobiales bacterium]